MKTMICNQLGGACDEVFRANTFEEMSALSQQHGKAMHEIQDPAHLEAMQSMRGLMKNPDEMKAWFDSKRKLFEELPED